MPVLVNESEEIGKAVEALIECGSGEVSYVVVNSCGIAGVDETLRAVPRAHIAFACDRLLLNMDKIAFDELAALETASGQRWLLPHEFQSDRDWPRRCGRLKGRGLRC